MRLVTWNACKGQFDRKVPLLDQLHADIAVIQEIASPAHQTPQVMWFGDNANQGFAVFARDPYRLTPLPQREGVPKYIVPVMVDGPISFVLFAVWTIRQQRLRYVRAAATAIEMYASTFEQPPVVLLGDFNSNAIWDTHHPAALNHSAMVQRLRGHGMVSAYHHFRGVPHGQETEPTFYLHWDAGKPYHIDYCFLPTRWADGIQHVEIGSFEAWREHSDHRPLLVDVPLEA
jgi:exonuclease III